MRTRISGSPNSQLWQFSLTAAGLLFFTAFAIAVVFFVIHQQRVSELSARSQLISAIMLEKSLKPYSSQLEQLTESAQAMMELKDFNSVVLLNASGEKVFEFGLPIEPENFDVSFTQADKWRKGSQLYLSRKIDQVSGQPLWLLYSIDLTYASLINLKFLFFSLLILCAILAFSVLLYRKLNREIFRPIESLSEIISKQNKTRDMSPIIMRQHGILEEFIQQINESFSIQIEKEMDLRKSMDSATQELRESLETVEIHNIDLDMARKNAVEMNKLKSDFLKKVSQDLRTPLSGIIGLSELLRKTHLSTQQGDYISTIEESTKGMLTIVGDIHDFSRLESGNLQVDKKPMELRRAVEETLTLQSPVANQRGVTLYSSVDADVPTTVLGDPLRVQQVLSNLVSNAIKFQHSSYIELCVKKVNQKNDEATIKIQIMTDGVCPSEFLDWQSEPDDLSATKELYSTTGMGLSVAKGIAHHMSGKVEFQNSDENRSFVVYLGMEISPSESSASIKSIDPSYQINALVYSNNDIGYREVTSRLYELGIHNSRANTFSEIISIAQQLKDESHKHARYHSIAVIEAQTSQQTLDKIVLTQTLKTLQDDFGIPTVIIAPMGQYEQLQKILKGMDTSITQHPLISSRFKKCILDQLGIVRLHHEKKPPCDSSASQCIRILVVDDNAANLKLACALLSDFNVQITKADSGTDAVSIFERGIFDLVFMDIQLPDISGFEATKKMRSLEQKLNNGNRTPIVALTAHDVAEEKTNLLLAGMDDFVGKPLTQKDISAIIDRWIISAKKKITTITPLPQNKTTQNAIKSEPEDEGTNISPVNLSDCLELAKNDPKLAADMLSMLIESLPQEKLSIEESIKEENTEKLYDHVHRLHGACCYSGTTRLKIIAKKLDGELRNNIQYSENDIQELYLSMEELEDWANCHDINALFDITE